MSDPIVSFDEAAMRGELRELVRRTVEDTLNALLEEEADDLIGADRYERTAGREAYRAGHYERGLTTTSGQVTLRMPKLKGMRFATAIIERYKRRETSVEEAMIEMYLAGVSTRRIEDVSEILWGASVSASTVSNLSDKAFEAVEEWRSRPLTRKYPYVFVDGIYLKRSWGGSFENVAVMVAIGVNDDGYIDYDAVRDMAKKEQPKMIIAGASAYPRAIDFEKFAEIAHEVGAYLFVDMAHIAGLVAAGLHQSPVPYADVVTTNTHKTLRGPRGGVILTNNEELAKKFNKAIFPGTQGGQLEHVIASKAVCFGEALQPEFKVYQQNIIDNAQALCKGLMNRGIRIVSGGTDNHLMLVDLTNFDQTGKAVEKLLDSVNITCNKNTIPNDPKSPFVTSGVRLGTPAVTSRGFNTGDMDQIAEAIAMMIKEGEPAADRARAIVAELTAKYPLK